MTKSVSAYEARTKLGEIINLVYYQGINVVINRMGKPMVKIVKIDEPTKVPTRHDALKLAGAWANKDGEQIESFARRLRKAARFSPPR